MASADGGYPAGSAVSAPSGGSSYRIAICCNGTRGDFQPYLSLAVVLQRAGHIVWIFTSIPHAKVAEDFGFKTIVTSGNIENSMRSDQARKAMEEGDLGILTNIEMENGLEGTTEERRERFGAIFKEFSPDAVVYNLIGMTTTAYFRGVLPDIPFFQIELQPQCIRSDDFKCVGLQRELPDPDTPNIMTFFYAAQQGLDSSMEHYAAIAGDDKAIMNAVILGDVETPESIWEKQFEPEKNLVPKICAYSPSFWPNPTDWPSTDKIQVVGNFKLSKEIQDEFTQKGSSFFTSGGGEWERCQDFISSGTPPVYIGWGSMVVYSKQHMTKLAVEALRDSGERGIVLGGWAQIDAEGLEGLDNEAELRAYCKDNIIFVKAAPHELLFPLCKACVHHGGIGTLQASLSAGCPTVVTPVFADQYDCARLVTDRGYGIGTTRLGLLKSDELGNAIRSVCGDNTFREAVTQLSAAMEQEDGVTATMNFIERFMQDEVSTGKYEKDALARRERLCELRRKNAKFKKDQIVSRWNASMMKMFPTARAFNDKNMAFMMEANRLASEKKLWTIQGITLLAREGEGLKTAEAGRFKQFAFLKEVEAKGSRVRVCRLRGKGPQEGWISPIVGGKEVAVRITDPAEIFAIQVKEFAAAFGDLQTK